MMGVCDEWWAPWGGLTALACWVALGWDRWWGEPPVRWHPVVWMGHYLGWAGRAIAPIAGAMRPTPDIGTGVLGACAWVVGATSVGVAAALIQYGLALLPWWLGVLGFGLCLKPLLAWAMLRREVLAVESALAISLMAGRERLAWLCSRDVTALSAVEVRQTAIETLAENLNDSVVAPLFWFAAVGLPGAAVYRFANTADAMWGYRGERDGRVWEWAGKWAARMDDAMSWLPARLTAILLALTVGGMAWRELWCEASRTPSPNSGWPMAAMALGLNVQLSKPGVYVLHSQGVSPTAVHLQRSVEYAQRVVAGCVGLAGLPVMTALLAGSWW